MYTYSSRRIVENAANPIDTGSLNSGLLRPEQSRRFLQQVFEATPLLNLVRREIRTAKTGEIDKIGIASRILRKKTENTDDNYRAGVKTSQIDYSCTAVRRPWEITEETLRENIEGQNFESIVTNLMTTQTGVDLEDLCLNGDEEAGQDDPDYDFLKINDGWIKQLLNGSHVEDRTSKNSGAMSVDVFYDALQQIPNKYNNGQLRWLMSPYRKQEWDKYLLNQIINQGGIVPDSVYQSPASIPVVSVPNMSNDKIILTNPQNLAIVNTYTVRIRKTTEGKEAIFQDKRFYVIHFDFDPVIEELDAAAIITGLSA